MPVLINFKICDNCEDCNGIKVCPTGAFHWDAEKRTIAVDKSKCIGCGACGHCCSNDAIFYTASEEEAKEVQKDIENDPRTIADLFVERYGAMPINNQYTFELSEAKVKNGINSNRPVIIEFNTNDNINCLLKSIPISEIVKAYEKNATYSKFIIEEADFKTFDVTETPCLRFYKEGKLLGEIKGYYEVDDFDKVKSMINKIKTK